MGIREEMPLLMRHIGEWDGSYTWVDPDGQIVDRHRAQLRCMLEESGGDAVYHQVNTYTWPDGRQETHDFPATYADGRLHFDTDRLRGHAWEVDDTTIVLTWRYKANPDAYYYEMINLSADGNNRTRVWHWFEHGVCVKRTLIAEHRVA